MSILLLRSSGNFGFLETRKSFLAWKQEVVVSRLHERRNRVSQMPSKFMTFVGPVSRLHGTRPKLELARQLPALAAKQLASRRTITACMMGKSCSTPS